MKPIIGVSAAWSNETLQEANFTDDFFYAASPYVNAIYYSGGIPVLLAPDVRGAADKARGMEIIERIDGLLLTGGGDLGLGTSRRYKPLLIEQQRCRYEFEARLIKAAWERDIPVLGICRGHQMMAEVLGGVISEKPIEGHGQEKDGTERRHKIILEDGSRLSQICGIKHWAVNSWHCQAAEKLPDRIQASAVCEDGIIEALEARDKKLFIGVQFHPELMIPYDDMAVKLFRVFIETAVRAVSGQTVL